MTISLSDAGKRYQKDWIFRNYSHTFSVGNSYALVGPNGSGKSTMLQVLAGFTLPTVGEVHYATGGGNIEPESVFREMAIVAPYLELPEDFTLKEFLHFHFQFKAVRRDLDKAELAERMQLEHATDKRIKNFSSGMKQRLKLGVAIFSDVRALLLDEPATNLDESGLSWYLENVQQVLPERLVLVASNRKEEYAFCTESIDLTRLK
jgi:ABC-type multidrug transport system ATPase subunit